MSTHPLLQPASLTTKADVLLQTSTILVAHFRNLLEHGGSGFHTRLFSHILHTEQHFVFAGHSTTMTADTPTYPEIHQK